MKKKCKFCNCKIEFFLSTFDYNRRYSKKKYKYFKCPNCQTIVLKNFPKNNSLAYRDGYYKTKNKNQIFKDNKNRIDYLLKLNLKKNSNILEIGSGYGEFLYCAKTLGYNPIGLDINPKLNNFTIKNYNIKTIINRKISSFKKKFDLIVSWHSLEHFENPKNILTSISKMIKKNGYLILSLPNPRSLGFKILKSKWPHLDAPRHRTLIDIKIIQKFFENKNFETILKTTNDKDSRYNNRLSYAIYVSNLFNSKSFFKIKKIERNFFHLVGVFLSMLFFPLENIKYNGSCYNIVLKKK